jgi:ABC-type glycerol-3-phosphate transport system substrate-binding protein
LGGATAAPPRDWGSLEAAVKAWGRGGVAALALPGREPDALVAWLAVLAAAGGPAAAAEAFTTFPLRGRETMAAAIGRLARLEAGGFVQKAAFSYPWQDAVGLVLQKKAAGILIPLGRYRGIDPVASAPFVTAGVPAFAGEGSVVVAEVRVLVMPRRGARGRGAERVVAFLAEPGPQRAVAEALHMVPARLDAPVRDGASFEAAAALRDAAVILPAPGLGLKDRDAAAVAAAAVSVLRSPAGAADAVAALYGAR